MPNQDFKLRPSKQYLVFLTLIMVTSIGIVLMLHAPIWAKALVLALLLVYGANLFYSTALLRGPFNIKRLSPLSDGKWLLTFREQNSEPAIEKVGELTGDSVATSLLMVLRFRIPEQNWPISCLIFRDSLPADEYRQLLVLLKS